MQRKAVLILIASLLWTALACQYPFDLIRDLTTQVEYTPAQEQSTPIPPTATPDFPRTVRLNADGSGDYPRIEAAVEALPAGSTIMLSSGDYYLTSRIGTRKSISIIGTGPEQTRIFTSTQYGAIRFDGPGEFNLQKVSVEYKGSTQGHVIEIVDAGFSLDECIVKGGIHSEAENKGGSGVWIEGNSIGTIRNSHFSENQAHGIQIRGESQVVLEYSTTRQNGFSGIFVAGNAYLEASNNEIKNNGDTGFVAVDNAGYALVNNTSVDNRGSGFAAYENTLGAFWGNYASGNEWHGYQLTDQAEASLENNQSMSNEKSGFLFSDASSTDMYSNTAESNGSNGVSVGDNATATLEGNTTNNNTEAGIVFFDQAGGLVKDNTCAYNQWGIFVYETANPILENNNCYGNTEQNLQDKR